MNFLNAFIINLWTLRENFLAINRIINPREKTYPIKALTAIMKISEMKDMSFTNPGLWLITTLGLRK
jgi:hypothetical protein